MATLLMLFVASAAISSAKHIQCKVECSREEKIDMIGFDIAKRPLQVDVGKCQTNLVNKTGCDQQHICIKQCVPRSHELQINNNRNGPIQTRVIRSCYPTYHHCLEGCEMKPEVLYLFPNSKYQTRVDIKKCVGKCNVSNRSCVPTKVKTKSVDGPNGPTFLSVTEECQCQFTVCYRQNYYHSYWNYSKCDNSTKLNKKEKLINVGRCIGDCQGVTLPGRCYPSFENCLLYIPGGPAKCVPTTYFEESYYNSNLQKTNIPVVRNCGCSSG